MQRGLPHLRYRYSYSHAGLGKFISMLVPGMQCSGCWAINLTVPAPLGLDFSACIRSLPAPSHVPRGSKFSSKYLDAYCKQRCYDARSTLIPCASHAEVVGLLALSPPPPPSPEGLS